MTAAGEFRGVLADYLSARGWQEATCGFCSRDFFGKGAGSCGSPGCPGSPVERPARPGPAARRTVAAHWARMSAAFTRRDLHPFAVADLGGTARDTDLIVSALQYLDPVVHQGAPVPDGVRILAQPCVRWRSLADAGRQEGISSSFVNLSSLEVDPGWRADRVAVHLDHWLEVLSAVGVHAREITIGLTAEDCAYGPYTGRRVDLNHRGLEIGEINWYHRVDDAASRPMTVVDCGFAFERIAWAVGGARSYHGMLSPLFAGDGNGVVNDRVRTLALLTLCGITAGARGPQRYARQLAGELAVPFLRGWNVRDHLEHATRFWRLFLPGAADGVPAAIGAIERQAVVRLAVMLDQAPPPPRLGFGDATEFLAARGGGPQAMRRAVDLLAV